MYHGDTPTQGGPIRTGRSLHTTRTSAPAGDAPDTSLEERRTISRELASLALAWAKQDRQLRVRQREQLRRALSAAARMMDWEGISDDELHIATRDIAKLAKTGTHSIRRELDRETAEKRMETVRLKAAVQTLREVAEEPGSVYPVDFSYSYTARLPSRGLVTKTEPLTLADAGEARAAADLVERRSEAWNKLRSEMLEELRLREQRWIELSTSLSSFAEASRGIVREVLAVLA